MSAPIIALEWADENLFLGLNDGEIHHISKKRDKKIIDTDIPFSNFKWSAPKKILAVFENDFFNQNKEIKFYFFDGENCGHLSSLEVTYNNEKLNPGRLEWSPCGNFLAIATKQTPNYVQNPHSGDAHCELTLQIFSCTDTKEKFTLTPLWKW